MQIQGDDKELVWGMLSQETIFSGSRVVKNPSANARDMGSILGSGRSSGGGNGNPLPYSCLEKPMYRGAWRATVHGAAKSWTPLKQLSSSSTEISCASQVAQWVKNLPAMQEA